MQSSEHSKVKNDIENSLMRPDALALAISGRIDSRLVLSGMMAKLICLVGQKGTKTVA